MRTVIVVTESNIYTFVGELTNERYAKLTENVTGEKVVKVYEK